MKLMVGSTQCGSTKATVGDVEASVAFSCSPAIVVPAGGSVTFALQAMRTTGGTQAFNYPVLRVIPRRFIVP